MKELLEMLNAHEVDFLVDVRTMPRSKHNLQFNKEAMPSPLALAGIEYVHMPGLVGLRHARKDSVNTGWLAEGRRAAMMCAESVPWRCHRALIADALTARGVGVRHIMGATKANPHRLTSFVQVVSARVTYPTTDPDLFSG